ncbi:hypothetical protein AGMMS49546_37840 [Spirochaetia bacterium]|nr:hypothetical protein AGMMS49546_37840 [Spirochaetia bacterium]
MIIEQTVEIPPSRRLDLHVDIPPEFPVGRTILTFTSAPVGEDDYVCPFCGKKEHIPNAETIAAMEEGDAMERGEIPAKRFHTIEEMLADLKR